MPSSALDDFGFGPTADKPTVPPAAASAQSPTPPGWNYPFSPDVVRTIVGEGDPAFVASVLRNRSTNSGLDYDTLVTQPNQFEARTGGAWKANSRLPVTDPKFQAALTAAAPILTGAQPPTGPWDSYYSPAGQKALGRVNPDGTPVVPGFAAQAEAGGQHGVNVGGNVAYVTGWKGGPPGSALGDMGFSAPGDTSGAPPARYGAGYGGAGQPSNIPPDAQARAFQFLQAHGFRDESTPKGSSTNPWGITPQSSPSQIGANDWYVTTGGQLRRNGDQSPDYLPQYQNLVAQRAAAAAAPLTQRIPTAIGQGLTDVAASVNKLTGGGLAAGDPTYAAFGQAMGGPSVYDTAQASMRGFQDERNRYDLLHTGDTPMAVARFGGQAVPLTAAGLATGGALGELGAGGEFLAGQGGGNLLTQGASRIAGGAIQGAQAAGLTSATTDRPLGNQLMMGAGLGGALGAVEPALAGGANRLITGAPVGTNPITDLASSAMNKWGIPLRAGQIRGAAGDRAAATADSNLLGASPKFAANNNVQKNAFMKGMTSTYGDASGDVSPSALTQAKSSLGSVFNRVAQNTPRIDADALLTNVGSIVKDAQSVLPDNEVTPLLRQVQNIGSAVDSGGLSGASYQALTRSGAPLDRLTSSDNPNVAHYAGQIRAALDDALQSAAKPEDVAALQQARFQYKNLMTVAKLAPKQDASGFISPALLRGAVNTNFKNNAFYGAGDLGELAQIGQTFMKEPPNSFTANRGADLIGGLGGMGLAALGEGAGALFHNPGIGYGALGTVGAAVAARGAQKVLGALKETRLGPGAGNRLMNPSSYSPAVTPYVLPSAVNAGNRFLPEPSP